MKLSLKIFDVNPIQLKSPMQRLHQLVSDVSDKTNASADDVVSHINLNEISEFNASIDDIFGDINLSGLLNTNELNLSAERSLNDFGQLLENGTAAAVGNSEFESGPEKADPLVDNIVKLFELFKYFSILLVLLVNTLILLTSFKFD